jgi:hypothetical protein
MKRGVGIRVVGGVLAALLLLVVAAYGWTQSFVELEVEVVRVATTRAPTTLPVVATVDDGQAYARALCQPPCTLHVAESVAQLLKLEKVSREGDLLLLLTETFNNEVWRMAHDEGWLATVATHWAGEGNRAKMWVLGRRTPRIKNDSLQAFLLDRASPEYGKTARVWSVEAYALLVQPPMEQNMYVMAQTAVYALRRHDPSRDVVVILVCLSEKEREVVARLKREFTTLGAVVIERPPLPMREIDTQMYYRFDYQKMYIWNLPYRKVMFIDSDMVVNASPARGFELCSGRKYAVCAVQEIRNFGGYFNNGFFVLVLAPPWNAEAETLLRAWWKPNAPWRQICLQDLMNEVYARKWQAMPEAFNVQTVKQGILPDSWQHAIFLHFKDCHPGLMPMCKQHLDNVKLMRAALDNSTARKPSL